MQAVIGSVTVECVVGDITAQADVDAVVNAANAELLPGGGVAGAIHAAAGPELAAECRPLAPIRPGDAVITSGQRLPNTHIIHCLGPVYGRDEPAAALLAECYRNALHLAEEHRLGRISFPALSTGAFGYPMAAAAEVALRTLAEEAQRLHYVRLIRLVLANEGAYRVHAEALSRCAPMT
ncbi:macro domain-containing protein [Nitrococcus mobilis]|uniref:Predicted phosphatase n=1 Tax=Nitrococcus mobilis Nb-231 TaxID=314278 RepID=A4BUI3_9GAMM|nr:macro domain-containing protein [Nitrococcus mobilis]EAR20697.1 Predicted phosphatase [Nitrococcus mobilis Nb-231]